MPKTLYRDPDFPTTPTDHKNREIEWKRPHQICKNPVFVDDYGIDDIEQGCLGDCWFLASIASICEIDKSYMNKIIPQDQNFEENYTGKFEFTFNDYGVKKTIEIDDRLPTRHGHLIYVQDKEGERQEFWMSLLEKAFAKYFGGYENIIAGNAVEALRVLMDTVAVSIKLKNKTVEDVKMLLEKGQMITASIDRWSNIHDQSVLNGLKDGHCYTVLGHHSIKFGPHRNETLVKIYNPHGRNEWQGAWSDTDFRWNEVQDNEFYNSNFRRPKDNDDGEFWMPISKFLEIYADMDVAFPKESWNHVDTFHDKWSVRNDTAGGFSPRKNNPTFEFEKRGDKLLIINLMQKEVRTKQFKDYFIGFRVLDSANGKQVHTTAAYRNGFNGAEIRDLPPGHYKIIATTYSPGEEGPFCVRVFEETDAPTRLVPDAGLRAVRSKRATRRWFEVDSEYKDRHRSKSVNLEQAMGQMTLDDIINFG